MKVIAIGKRLVPAQQIAFVEPFDPASNPEFKPEKDYKTRLKWRDLADNEQSKLLVTAPETVIAETLNRELELPVAAKRPARRQTRGRSGSRRMEAFRS